MVYETGDSELEAEEYGQGSVSWNLSNFLQQQIPDGQSEVFT